MYQPHYPSPAEMPSRLDKSRTRIYGYGGDCRPQCTRPFGHTGPCYPKGPAPVIVVHVAQGVHEYHPAPNRDAERDRQAAIRSTLTPKRHRVIRPKADPLATAQRPVGWHYTWAVL